MNRVLPCDQAGRVVGLDGRRRSGRHACLLRFYSNSAIGAAVDTATLQFEFCPHCVHTPLINHDSRRQPVIWKGPAQGQLKCRCPGRRPGSTLHGMQEVAGSNPASSTVQNPCSTVVSARKAPQSTHCVRRHRARRRRDSCSGTDGTSVHMPGPRVRPLPRAHSGSEDQLMG